MADVVDTSEQFHSEVVERKIKSIRDAAQRREVHPKGRCHVCEEEFEEGDKRLFCGSDCSAEYERIKVIKK